MSTVEVIIRLRADGSGFRVEIEALGASASDAFVLPPAAWRDFVGSSIEPGTTRGLVPVRELTDHGKRESPELLGKLLFQALFPARVRSVLDQARGSARPLHLRLVWDPNDERLTSLHRLPWELMRVPETAAVLVLEPHLSLSRQIQIAIPRAALAPPERLRIVVVAANPRDTESLNLGKELAAFRALDQTDTALTVTVTPRPTDLLSLRTLLARQQAHILHFMGHGEIGVDGEGRLLFENSDGWARSVTGDQLARTLQGLEHLRLVVLNACRSAEIRARPYDSVAARLVQSGLPAVIAMQAPISDDVAIAFSRELYPRLARGHVLESAVCLARHAIHAHALDSTEWAIPVLFANVASKTLGGLAEDELPIDELIVRERYLAWMIEHHSELDIPWLADAGRRPRLPLDAIHVLFRRDHDPPAERSRSLQRRPDPASLERLLSLGDLSLEEEHLVVWRQLRKLARGADLAEPFAPQLAGDEAAPPVFSFDEILTRHDRVVLLGELGSGKSSLLRWLSRRSAESLQRGEKRLRVDATEVDPRRDDGLVDLGRTRLPILVDLAAYAHQRRHRQGRLRLAEFLGRHLGPELDLPAADGAGGMIEPEVLRRLLARELRRGHAMLLADGLDQIGDGDERLEIVKEVEDFLAAFGCSMVISCRRISYSQAAFASPSVCFGLEPLVDSGLEHLCRRWGEVLSLPANRLRAAVAALQQQGTGELKATPLLVSILAAVLQRSGGHLPTRRIELYAPTLAILLDRWRDLASSATELATPLQELLATLAADLHDRPESFGLIEHRRLAAWLEEHCNSNDAKVFARWLHRDLGPLVPYSQGVFGFLHRTVQEYLAACWLAAEPAEAEQRLLQHLDDPTWRVPSAMALGLLADTLDAGQMNDLLRRLMANDADTSRPIPSAAFLLLEALRELPASCSLPVTELSATLLSHAATDDGGVLGTAIEAALASLLTGRHLEVMDRALASLLERDVQTLALPLARIARAASEVPQRLSVALAERQAGDRPPWPIDKALRHLRHRDPFLLPRRSVSRLLHDDTVLASRVADHPRWRRLIHAVHGDSSRPYRQSGLDAEILAALSSECEVGVLKPGLRRLAEDGPCETARPARMALLALGEMPPLPDLGARRSFAADLERTTSETAPADEASVWILPLVAARQQLDTPTWLTLVRTIANQLQQRQRTELFLLLAAEVSGYARARLLGDFWCQLLLQKRSEEIDPIHQVAIVLDRHGAFLTSPIADFINSWLAVGRPTLDLPLVADRPTTEHLAAVLDIVAGIADPFDFVRAWVLVVLRDDLAEHRLLDEAVLLAETSLSDRLDARGLARSRLLGNDAVPLSPSVCLARADALEDPWRRHRALRRLASQVADLRHKLTADHIATDRILLSPATLAASSITDPDRRRWPLARLPVEAARSGFDAAEVGDDCDGEISRLLAAISQLHPARIHDRTILAALAEVAQRWLRPATSTDERHGRTIDPLTLAEAGELDSAILAAMLELLEHGDDLERLRAALALHGDRTVLRRRWSIRKVGFDVALRMAEHWLRCRRDAPQTALILRWTFQALVHDSPHALRRAVHALQTPGVEADAAEMVLRFVETVTLETLSTLGDLLGEGPPRARQALVRGLPTLLAIPNYRADAIWSSVEKILPATADCFGEQKVHLGSFAALVDAMEQSRIEGGGAARAAELHAATAIPWADLLRREPQELRAALQHLGERRRVGEHSSRQAGAAATRIMAQPALLPLLLDWLELRLDAGLARDTDDRATSDLLQMLSAAARQLPRTYFEATAQRPHWQRRLTEVVEYADWLSARRAAVELLGMSRQLGDRELRALLAALLDAPEVQRSALDSLACYRRLDDVSSLAHIEATLRTDRPSHVFAAARLLAAIARPPHCEQRLRRRIESVLTITAVEPTARRPVHVFDYSITPHNRFIKIATVGRLDRLVRGLLLDIQGRPESVLAKPSENL